MKGIVLAGGTGSRLFPCTKVTNKHLLPVYNKPMIYYPLQTLIGAGITDIMIVSGPDHADHFKKLLADSPDFPGITFTFAVQEQAGGIAQALGLCRSFAGDDRIAVILGDNIFEDSISGALIEYARQESGARIFLKQVTDPQRFGVAQVRDGAIVSIEEKPLAPKSDLAVTGLYLYDADVWDAITNLKPSGRGELEITDVNNFYIKKGTMTYAMLRGQWTDAGTFSSLLRANIVAARASGADVRELLGGGILD